MKKWLVGSAVLLVAGSLFSMHQLQMPSKIAEAFEENGDSWSLEQRAWAVQVLEGKLSEADYDKKVAQAAVKNKEAQSARERAEAFKAFFLLAANGNHAELEKALQDEYDASGMTGYVSFRPSKPAPWQALVGCPEDDSAVVAAVLDKWYGVNTEFDVVPASDKPSLGTTLPLMLLLKPHTDVPYKLKAIRALVGAGALASYSSRPLGDNSEKMTPMRYAVQLGRSDATELFLRKEPKLATTALVKEALLGDRVAIAQQLQTVLGEDVRVPGALEAVAQANVVNALVWLLDHGYNDKAFAKSEAARRLAVDFDLQEVDSEVLKLLLATCGPNDGLEDLAILASQRSLSESKRSEWHKRLMLTVQLVNARRQPAAVAASRINAVLTQKVTGN